MVKRLRDISQAKGNIDKSSNSLAARVEALSNTETTDGYVAKKRGSLADRLNRVSRNS